MAADEAPEDRLEAALERIAKIVDMGGVATRAEPSTGAATTELTDRLDRIIDALRDALGK